MTRLQLSDRTELLFLFAVVLVSRLPFLWAGFGSEEDAWLLPVTARNIALSGIYEMSRAPAHPLQEYLYSYLYIDGLSPVLTNFISALSSAFAALFFALILRNYGSRHYLFGAFAFAFMPAVFIASTYTIDYMPAMAFALGSWWLAVYNKRSSSGLWILSGITLGFATGFRLTSLAMALPFGILIYLQSEKQIRPVLLFWLAVGSIALVTYIPVLRTYGLDFFTYADQFPYPNLFKTTYKITIGVFGLIGTAAISYYKWKVWIPRFRTGKYNWPAGMPKLISLACYTAFLLYIIAYLRLPQKSAYLIPIVPFLLLLFSYYLSSYSFRMICVLMTASSFFFSINLTDPLRGSEHSPAAMKFNLAGQEIFIDPLTGPLYSDYTKRLNKSAYVDEIYNRIQSDNRKMVIIGGWFYNQLSVRYWKPGDTSLTMTKNGHINYVRPNLVLVYYIDQPTMEKFLAEGYELFYLPEQDLYNDQYSGMEYTRSVAKAY